MDPIEVTTKIADVASRMRKAPKNPPRDVNQTILIVSGFLPNFLVGS